jgi:alkylhydroperoxidase family enzyme
MARVKYLQASDVDSADRAVFDRLLRERKVPTANIFLALANAPKILDAFLTYANALRAAELSPKLRELAILTVGHSTSSIYEIAHHQSHASNAGVSADQLSAIPDFETSSAFSAEERAVMAFAKASTLNVKVSDEIWASAAAYLSNRQMVELVLTVAWYNSGVRIMDALSIDLEDGYR